MRFIKLPEGKCTCDFTEVSAGDSFPQPTKAKESTTMLLMEIRNENAVYSNVYSIEMV